MVSAHQKLSNSCWTSSSIMTTLETRYSLENYSWQLLYNRKIIFRVCVLQYSDNYYRAAMIEALANTVSAAVTTVTITGWVWYCTVILYWCCQISNLVNASLMNWKRQGPSTDLLTADIKLILEEVTRHLNMEKLLPSYRLTVTVRWARLHVNRHGQLDSMHKL